MNLKTELLEQRRAVAEFENALEDVKNPPKYQPATPSEPLTYLQQQMAQAANEADRQQKIKHAELALEHSKDVLAKLEQQWSQSESEADAARSQLEKVANEINELSQQLSAKSAELLALVDQHRSALSEHDPQFRVEGQMNLNSLPDVQVSAASVSIGRLSPVFVSSGSPFAA